MGDAFSMAASAQMLPPCSYPSIFQHLPAPRVAEAEAEVHRVRGAAWSAGISAAGP